MEHWWNDTDSGKPKCLEKDLSQHQFVHCKSHMNWLWISPRPQQREAGY
jgi:hypothetical protein